MVGRQRGWRSRKLQCSPVGHGGTTAINLANPGFSVGGASSISRNARKAWSSTTKNVWSSNTSSARAQAASNMKSERFLPCGIAAKVVIPARGRSVFSPAALLRPTVSTCRIQPREPAFDHIDGKPKTQWRFMRARNQQAFVDQLGHHASRRALARIDERGHATALHFAH